MKRLYIKVYKRTGVAKAYYLKNLTDFSFSYFRKNLDGGLGECVIRIGDKFDDYEEFETINLGNLVELVIVDEDTPEGDRIYKGYISAYRPILDGAREEVEVTLLGMVTKLGLEIYKSSTSTTVIEAATPVSTMMQNIITTFTAEVDKSFKYDTRLMTVTGLEATYSFRAMTYLDSVNKVKDLGPSNWHWYLDEDDTFVYKRTSTTPDHSFTNGGDITNIQVRKDIENLRNVLYLYNGKTGGDALYKRYTDETSILKYGERAGVIIDSRFGNETTMDNYASTWLARRKDPQLDITLEIADNNENSFGYDIETINPGDTCRILGFDVSLSETFTDNMLITEVEYHLDRAVLKVQPIKKEISRDLIELKESVGDERSTDIPSTYST